MAKKEATMSDLYMQFVSFEADLHSVSTDNMVQTEVQTGLSVRGNLVWLIHQIELYLGAEELAVPMTFQVALSTQPGIAGAIGGVLEPNDTGVLVRWNVGAGAGSWLICPIVYRTLPPIPFAAPKLYWQIATTTHEVALVNKSIQGRIAYTTTPMETALYTELLEVWGG